MKSVVVGYAEHSKAYILFDPESNTIEESHDVEFFEHKFNVDSKDIRTKISESNPSQGLEPQNSKRHVVQNKEPRKSQRQRK